MEEIFSANLASINLRIVQLKKLTCAEPILKKLLDGFKALNEQDLTDIGCRRKYCNLLNWLKISSFLILSSFNDECDILL